MAETNLVGLVTVRSSHRSNGKAVAQRPSSLAAMERSGIAVQCSALLYFNCMQQDKRQRIYAKLAEGFQNPISHWIFRLSYCPTGLRP